MAPTTDWAAVMDRVLDEDPIALAQVGRLVNGFLARWRAYDFRPDWDDVIQEAVTAAALALREGRVRERGAIYGYLRSVARYQFSHRLKRHVNCREKDALPWDEASETLQGAQTGGLVPEMRQDLRRAIGALPEKTREAIVAVYLAGQTYEEAARQTGIPLGSLKRYLREGLACLRGELGGS